MTERIFGLNWEGISRFPTGIPREDLEKKRKEFQRFIKETLSVAKPYFERMYSIKIKRGAKQVYDFLGTFGEDKRLYFKPRFVKVRRISGAANTTGTVLLYQFPFRSLNFQIKLENLRRDRYLVYRIKDGFGRGGMMVFNFESHKDIKTVLSIYVAFDLISGGGILRHIKRILMKGIFPGYIHDVLWNHSLCHIKSLIETS
jgi:hypothetical protein